LVEFAELLDVDMKEFSRRLAFISAHGLRRIESFELVKAKAFENAADGGRRDPLPLWRCVRLVYLQRSCMIRQKRLVLF
jgi:hypothetical protein